MLTKSLASAASSASSSAAAEATGAAAALSLSGEMLTLSGGIVGLVVAALALWGEPVNLGWFPRHFPRHLRNNFVSSVFLRFSLPAWTKGASSSSAGKEDSNEILLKR
jgi:hypothetical protein